MGNKMCFCSCLPMTSSEKEEFDIEDNQTFVYTPATFKPTEVQRTQIKRQSNANNTTADLFTIFDKSLLLESSHHHHHHVNDMSASLYLINESNRQSLTSNSSSSQSPSPSSSSNQLLDAGSLLETSIVVEEDDNENIDAISVDSGICNSNRSSLSVICDDKQQQHHRQCEEINNYKI